ncbi:hypothetical protein VWN77_10720, partial [Campylobacter coli]
KFKATWNFFYAFFCKDIARKIEIFIARQRRVCIDSIFFKSDTASAAACAIEGVICDNRKYLGV